MEHTATYGLTQWSKSDRIEMEDFNSDNLKLEQALAGLADANPYVKIKEMTLSSASKTCTLNVSGVDFSAYHKIELYCSAASPTTPAALRTNGQTSGYTRMAASGYGSGTSASTDYVGRLGGILRFYMPRSGTPVSCWWCLAQDSTWEGYQATAPVNWEDLTALNLVCDTAMPKGTTITLFGLRK